LQQEYQPNIIENHQSETTGLQGKVVEHSVSVFPRLFGQMNPLQT